MADALGVVAAGSRHTASAAVDVLRAGGNAVDAAVAACVATSAAEPSLTSLAGGGALVFRDATSGAVHVCDFNGAAPGRGGGEATELDFFGVELDFGPVRQTFHVGRGSAAVPGTLQGLAVASERWGRLPLTEIVRPACRLMRDGVVLDDYQAWCFSLLAPILMHSEPVRRVYARDGRLLGPGDTFTNPAAADTLERMAAQGAERFLRDDLAPAILESFGPEAGGTITPEDLVAYRVGVREPLRASYRGWQLWLPPRPFAGGEVVALALSLLEQVELGADPWGSQRHLLRLCACMRTVEEARADGAPLLEPGSVSRWRRRFVELLSEPPAPGPTAQPARGPGNTTHISVLDADGGAAAVTLTYGEGCGYMIGDTGIVMNNMMGEDDLHPAGFHTAPAGIRLQSMVSPCVVRAPDGSTAVLGTGGSSRIRTAMLQVITNLVDFGMESADAVRASRRHWEAGVLNAETFGLSDADRSLRACLAPGEELKPAAEPNLFFGGVHLARRAADGALSGAGDPRRAGVTLVA